MQIKHVFKHGTCILDTKGRIMSLFVARTDDISLLSLSTEQRNY